MAIGKVRKFRLHERDELDFTIERKIESAKTHRREHLLGGFSCLNCHEWAPINETIGTHNRNHCPHCLWSRHMDKDKQGDRKSECRSSMEPIALTFKDKRPNRYEVDKDHGELMIVHECISDGSVSINRIANDDSISALELVFHHGLSLPEEQANSLANRGIKLADALHETEVISQLFGRHTE